MARDRFRVGFDAVVAGEERTHGMGGSVTWRPADGWLAGADLRRSEWEGVAQDLTGVFVQKDLVAGPRLRWLVGGRFDVWENADTETSFNPRMGVVYRASSAATLRASAYRGFRAPTLNELYRPFRVGNVETLANPELQEERLVGAELGLDLVPRREVLLRLNTFWNELDSSVGNVTIATTPDGILRAATLFDLYVEHPLARVFTVSLAVENLFDETVEVGRLPELRVGPPRLVYLGVQFSR